MTKVWKDRGRIQSKALYFKCLHARFWRLDPTIIEVQVEMPLGEGSRIKTADGKMPSGWEKVNMKDLKQRFRLHVPRVDGTYETEVLREKSLKILVGKRIRVPELELKYGK